MPDLTLTLSTAQLARVIASGVFDKRNDAGELTATTQAITEAWLMAQLATAVRTKELANVSDAASTQRRTELAAEGW